MKSINKKIITVSLILLIACSLPILMEENRVFNDIKIKNIEHRAATKAILSISKSSECIALVFNVKIAPQGQAIIAYQYISLNGPPIIACVLLLPPIFPLLPAFCVPLLRR